MAASSLVSDIPIVATLEFLVTCRNSSIFSGRRLILS